VTDLISLGVLASSVPRDAVDDAVAAWGRQARRRDGKLPPHVVVYFVMAMALFADCDYEEVAARLAGTLGSWGCWDGGWEVPTSGGITQARQRLGWEPLAELFGRVACPVADAVTEGAFLGRWRLMAIDGTEFDVPDTAANAAEFGRRRGGEGAVAAFPKARLVTVSECGSHAMAAAAIGGKGTGEQALARQLYPGLEEDWLLIADRNFYGWADWCAAAGTGAALLWRVKKNLGLPVLRELADGSYLSVVMPRTPDARKPARQQLLDAARAGADLDPARARYVRVIEYQAGTGGEQVILVTTITSPREAPAPALAAAYHQRWEHETAYAQLKTSLRGPGRVLRSRSPDMARQEIYGYLLTHYAISALICAAAAEAAIDPDRVSFTRTLHIIRRHATAAFPP
jgi:Insertion element 4 transposase N-terminal/Transposase DDE domain